jgi:hypothetical protein
MSYVKDKIATFKPVKYNQFYWWRRFKARETLHPYKPLYDKIKNGDYEMSDYFYQAKHELELLNEKLIGVIDVKARHEITGLSMERYRRLMNDYEKDEEKIIQQLKKDFKTVFQVPEEEMDRYMEECDGDLMCLYNTVKQDYVRKRPDKEYLFQNQTNN